MSGDHGYDGPTLRSVREHVGVALRQVARHSRMSHGHLSKVERGEPGRPVTPAVLSAYEKATGVKLTGMAGHGSGEPFDDRWRRGQLSEARRRTLLAKIAAVAVGGQLGEQLERILDATGRPRAPKAVEALDAVQVEHTAAACTTVDLRHGGAVVHEMARAQLRWAAGLLTADRVEGRPRLFAAVAALAQRAGWAAFDADCHEVARSLFTVGLYAATHADDPDLRAHVIADIAAQHNFLGYPGDSLFLARLAEVDERVGSAVRMVIHCVKARAHAVQGEADACRRQVGLAEQAHANAQGEQTGGWQATVATAAQLHAGVGHALATLARRSDSAPAGVEARRRLAMAAAHLNVVDQARAAALCMAQLATLHLEAGEPDHGVSWGRRLLDAAGGIRSRRLTEHLARLRTAADAHADEVAVKQLVVDLEAPA